MLIFREDWGMNEWVMWGLNDFSFHYGLVFLVWLSYIVIFDPLNARRLLMIYSNLDLVSLAGSKFINFYLGGRFVCDGWIVFLVFNDSHFVSLGLLLCPPNLIAVLWFCLPIFLWWSIGKFDERCICCLISYASLINYYSLMLWTRIDIGCGVGEEVTKNEERKEHENLFNALSLSERSFREWRRYEWLREEFYLMDKRCKDIKFDMDETNNMP